MYISRVENGYCVRQTGVIGDHMHVFKNFKELVEFMETEFGEPDFTGGLKG
jgi:hypothetical protein